MSWERTVEEQLWLEELANVLRPFISVADAIPMRPGEDDLDERWPPPSHKLTKEHWLLLRKVVTGVT